jgi:energy-converting hydrogenase Eha subunit B
VVALLIVALVGIVVAAVWAWINLTLFSDDDDDRNHDTGTQP